MLWTSTDADRCDAVTGRFAERDNKNLVPWSEFDRCGHFAAMEEPDLLIGDVRKFIGRFD